MSQFEKINDNLKMAYSACVKNGFSESAIEQINVSLKAIQNVEGVNEHYKELYDRIKSCLIELQDIGDTIYDDLNKNVFDEERYNYVDNRIDYLKTLFRKYGGNYENLINYYDEISIKFS